MFYGIESARILQYIFEVRFLEIEQKTDFSTFPSDLAVTNKNNHSTCVSSNKH